MRLSFLRYKSSKPIPKKGTAEYLELQKRLIERKQKLPDLSKELEIPEKIPKFFKYMLITSVMPPTIGTLGMLTSDCTSLFYHNCLAMTGSWIGISAVLLNAYLLGLETFMYTKPFYADPKNFFFIGSRRVFFSALSIPMGFWCLKSTFSADWVGFLVYFIWLQINTLTTIRSTEHKLIPGWLGNGHWPWLVYTQLITVFITYSLFSRNCKDSQELS